MLVPTRNPSFIKTACVAIRGAPGGSGSMPRDRTAENDSTEAAHRTEGDPEGWRLRIYGGSNHRKPSTRKPSDRVHFAPSAANSSMLGVANRRALVAGVPLGDILDAADPFRAGS